MNLFLKGLKKSVLLSAFLFILCGLIYPLFLTGVGQILFPKQANGSFIMVDGKAVGSEIVGQNFTDSRFMKCRPSAVNYNTYTKDDKGNGSYAGLASGSNNYGPSNPALTERVKKDMERILEENPNITMEDIPADLVTASGSGLDPHISPASAALQIPELVNQTGLSKEQIEDIVKNNTENKKLTIFGEQTVNVLKVNIEIAKAIGIIES